MKYFGKKIDGPNTVFFVIPRAGQDIGFTVQAVLDYSDFDRLCPQPKPPKMLRRGSRKQEDDFDSPTYKVALDQWAQKKVEFVILHALKATEGLEWETVDDNNPDTWKNVAEELKDAKFTPMQITYIHNKCIEVNTLNEDKLEEARERFLAEQQDRLSENQSQKEELKTTQNGVPVSVLASNPQK